MKFLHRYFPILTWGREYTRQTLGNDLVVAVIVTLMLIPQSLAYALVAGLPPEVGLYASMAPLLMYAVFGTSRALAVGPVAVASLMTATAISQFAAQGTPEYLGAAIAMAFVSGLLLVVMGLLRLGFMANFLSHPVVSGFITASGVQIAAGQLASLLGVKAHGETFLDIAKSLVPELGSIHPQTAILGIGSRAFLFWVRGGLKPLLKRCGIADKTAGLMAKLGPVAAIVLTTVAVWSLGLGDKGVKIVGEVPRGLPKIALATLFLTPLLFFLPKATLAATIIAAVLSLVDFGAMRRVFSYSLTDFAAMAATILLTLIDGVEAGLIAGVGLSIFLHLYRTSKPHVAVVGQLPGTMNFRNVERHQVVTDPALLSLRVDASFYFPNARFLEDTVNNAIAGHPGIRHVILECPAVNTINISGLESLEAINARLKDAGISLHLSEVKGPVMDRLKRSDLLEHLTGKVHLTHYDAVASIAPGLARKTLESPRT